MDIKVVVFDFFGVISSEVFPIWAKRYFSDLEYKEIRDNIVIKGDIGEISSKEMFLELGKLVGMSGEEVFNDWVDLAVINNLVIELILELKKKYKIALLSNANGDFIKKVLERIDTDKLFDYMIISSDVKMIKPNRDIFELLRTKTSVSFSNLIFIDDNLSNVEGAEKFGIKGIVFKDVEQLKEELEDIIKK